MAYRLAAAPAAVLLAIAGLAGASHAQTRGIGAGGDDNAVRCQLAAEEDRSDPESLRLCTTALANESLKKADRAATYANRAVILVNRKSFVWAAADCDKALALAPNNGAAYVNRGAARLGQKRFQDALADIDEGLKLDPPNPSRAWYNRGLAHEGLGDARSAVDDYKMALKLRPDWPLAMERLKVAEANAR
jgi:tetratricopeptide (TPR) repeat protein